MPPCHLADYLETSAGRAPHRTAVVEPDGRSLTYRELEAQADALAAHLAGCGVVPGDRVGVVLRKSIEAVVALFGVMKAGAAYVPVDYAAPAERARRILTDCRVRAVIIDHRCLSVVPEAEALGGCPAVVLVAGDSVVPSGMAPFKDATQALSGPPARVRTPSDLAYLLYTSGSTGVPKGVKLTHENAVSFVEWASSAFELSHADHFASHAPFHFDLSVFDIYVAIRHGAELHLVPDDLGKSPKDLARFIETHRITVWYSTPSILTLLLQFGGLEALDVSALRIVLFAGEVFPVKHLRELQRRWPRPAYFNLYGPTETNVCTFAAIPSSVPADRDVPFPIGYACSHCRTAVLDAAHREVSPGEEGLLYVAGPSVFSGYWNRPAEDAEAFLERDGVRWYNTGDVVRWDPHGGYIYVGRRDRMVKRRGYRIELGEIERALYGHPDVREAAIIAVPDADSGVRIVAFLACHGDVPPSFVDLKIFLASKLPAYMSPDRFLVRPTLPKTSTDKVDYQGLRALLSEVSAG